MELAISLYKGGEVFAAVNCDYSSSKELGLICPFCRESVFLAKGELKAPHWRHYKLSLNSSYCENRALSKEGKDELKQLQSTTARNQRLKLFNRRFWDIYNYEKDIPKTFKHQCRTIFEEEHLRELTDHCLKLWDTEEILKMLPDLIKNQFTNPKTVAQAIARSPVLQGNEDPEIIQMMAKAFSSGFSNLRFKILSEVILWLKSPTAKESFFNLVCLACLDALEAFPPPIHSQKIQDIIIISLLLTRWPEAIEALQDKSRALGFG